VVSFDLRRLSRLTLYTVGENADALVLFYVYALNWFLDLREILLSFKETLIKNPHISVGVVLVRALHFSVSIIVKYLFLH
jgi:hypothetical protein